MRYLLLIFGLVLTLSAQPNAEIVHRFQGGMERPTDLAVLNDGRICVADGVNGRVLVFQEDGKYEEIRFPELKRPLGLATDLNGGLLITDTETDAILILDKYLMLKVRIPLDKAVDATDVLVVDENLLWVVDNDNHHIIVIDRQGRINSTIGRKGIPVLMPLRVADNTFFFIILCTPELSPDQIGDNPNKQKEDQSALHQFNLIPTTSPVPLSTTHNRSSPQAIPRGFFRRSGWPPLVKTVPV